MAVSSGAFIVALNTAPVANALFMQALAPILAAALGTFLGEPALQARPGPGPGSTVPPPP